MKFKISWRSSHARVQLRLLRASGDDVKILDDHGAEQAPPTIIRSQDVLRIAGRFVAYGAEQRWMLRVFVEDPSNTPLKGLSVQTMYDDTVEPDRTEDLVTGADVRANEASDHEKTLTIPRRRAP